MTLEGVSVPVHVSVDVDVEGEVGHVGGPRGGGGGGRALTLVPDILD